MRWDLGSLRAYAGRTRALAIEGGGINGLAYVGVLEGLEAIDVPSRLTTVAGTSAGAITALLCCLGADSRSLRALMEETQWDRFTPQRWRILTAGVRLLRRGWGMYPLDYPRSWIESILERAHFRPSVTLGELRRHTGRRLLVAVTNEDLARPELFTPETHPDVRVVDAVLASMAIPFVWPQVVIDGFGYSDGGATWNHPVDALDGPPESILGLRVDTPREIAGALEPVTSLAGRARRLLTILRAQAHRGHVPALLWPRIVRAVSTTPATQFVLGPRERALLVHAGREALALAARPVTPL